MQNNHFTKQVLHKQNSFLRQRQCFWLAAGGLSRVVLLTRVLTLVTWLLGSDLPEPVMDQILRLRWQPQPLPCILKPRHNKTNPGPDQSTIIVVKSILIVLGVRP